MIARYSRWHDRLRAAFPGARRRRLRLTQAVIDQRQEEIWDEVEVRARDLLLYGATYVGPDGERIPPDEVRVAP